ncbi:MAG TPA: MFS transporter [Pseudonocardia sp.]|nr:MFS transporter [Pseudonocardia sp.]
MSQDKGADRDGPVLRRMTLATAWGEGLDGYDLGVISVVLPLITTGLGLSPAWAGLIAASALIGIFIGAPIAGYLTDRFGRRRMFLLDIAAFVVLGVAQGFVTEPWQLFVIRLLLGVAIGAEYAIGAAMLAELAPTRGRGRRLSKLLVSWYVGFLISVVAAYLLVDLAGWGWQWVLVTGAVPALVVLLMRIGLPESPRWLIQQGRTDEARAIIDRDMGGEAYYRAEEYHAEEPGAGWRRLFSPELRSRTLFVCVFWSCNVAPYFAIFTFAPQVFSSLQLADERAGTIAANSLAAAGAVVGMLTIERLGRRRQLIIPFWITTGTLLVVGLWSNAPGVVLVLCFAVFAFFNALQGNLTAVYPIEVFPTDVRSSGVGIGSAVSRIGAAVGTFLLPVGLSTIGVGACMLIGAGLCALGGIVSQRLAPETTGHTLTRTATLPAGKVAPAA